MKDFDGMSRWIFNSEGLELALNLYAEERIAVGASPQQAVLVAAMVNHFLNSKAAGVLRLDPVAAAAQEMTLRIKQGM